MAGKLLKKRKASNFPEQRLIETAQVSGKPHPITVNIHFSVIQNQVKLWKTNYIYPKENPMISSIFVAWIDDFTRMIERISKIVAPYKYIIKTLANQLVKISISSIDDY